MQDRDLITTWAPLSLAKPATPRFVPVIYLSQCLRGSVRAIASFRHISGNVLPALAFALEGAGNSGRDTCQNTLSMSITKRRRTITNKQPNIIVRQPCITNPGLTRKPRVTHVAHGQHLHASEHHEHVSNFTQKNTEATRSTGAIKQTTARRNPADLGWRDYNIERRCVLTLHEMPLEPLLFRRV